ncbi:MauE/DoxX family redox-associated membrane protein [Paenibacillus antarcticus]|uniref:Methylamine utilisation protein MauE domain-containing protein n=1 Tax=Paenibacillus antarcticus TaxID=253703 RepID=A0A168JV86_9BACL|nr:MauE/DoxX family redox-associated membrane protein [Paenibacillus antarcticus]OAB41154.1 hypothetical protein PBAT_21575 [Paenibacillus antarcticus]
MLSIMIFLLDYVMGGLFVVAFYFKKNNFRDLELSVQSYRVLPLSLIRIASIGLLLFEFCLFISFASGQALYYKELGAIALLLAFSFFVVRKRRLDNDLGSTCSCFGSIGILNRYPLSRNSILIGLCASKCLLPAAALSAQASFRQFIIHSVVMGSCLFLVDYYQTRKRYIALQVRG